MPAALAGPVVVRHVPAGSPAAAAGLREGDVILDATNLLTAQTVDLSATPATNSSYCRA